MGTSTKYTPPAAYAEKVRSRSTFRYLLGLYARWKSNRKYEKARRIARRRGAIIGDCVVMPLSLAYKANKNLVVGNHVSIHSDKLDLRNKITIGDFVIIGSDVEIVTTSHNIDSPLYEHKGYGVEINDYVWIAPSSLILPSCRKIGRGAVIGAGSVVVKNVSEMSVISGNPALEIRKRKCVHSELVVESLLSGDYDAYKASRK